MEGTYEPFVSVYNRGYSREECHAIYTKAEDGELLTKEEAAVVGAWLVHPLNTNLAQAPYAIGVFLRRRDAMLSEREKGRG